MNNSYLAHHGVLGMKWGVRRYQNKDGSLTEEGLKKRIKKINKKTIQDKRTRAVIVHDKKTGEHIGVSERILKTRGKRAALKAARNPKLIAKDRAIQMSYFDKTYDEFYKYYKNDEKAYKAAFENFMEVHGYFKKPAEDLIRQYSKYGR